MSTMELWKPEPLALDHVSNALMEDVEAIARRVHELRPLPTPVVKRIEEELLGERVYSSNAIEGNTLDFRETVMILKQGTASGGRKREALEALNLAQAVKNITAWIDAGESCHTTAKLLEVHGILLREIDDVRGGRFRQDRVMIQAAAYQPPDHSLVPALVDRILETLTRPGETEPLLRAVWAHWALARVHPFYDGNGRIARLWQDLVLLQGRLTCAIIRPEDRRTYLDALSRADEGDFNPLVQLVAQRVSVTFDKYLAALREEAQQDQFVKDLVGEAGARTEEERRLSYLRWSRKMEQLRWEFELCASRITEASPDIKIQVRSQDLINQTRWENIRSGRLGEPSGFFGVDFVYPGKRWRYWFFFGKHIWLDGLDDDQDRSEPRVCLLISEDDCSGAKATPLYKTDDRFITLREIFVTDAEFVRKRIDAATGDLVYDRNVSPIRLAQDFIREVIFNRLT